MANVIEVTGVAGRLQAKIAPLITEVSARSHMIAAHPNPRSTYRALLELLYTEVRTTVPLLVAVDNRAGDLAAQSDDVARAMSPWLRQHIVEETDHDTWLIRDYIRIGGDPDALVARAGWAHRASPLWSDRSTTGRSTRTRWQSWGIARSWRARHPPEPSSTG
jgi:hypothetical protein